MLNYIIRRLLLIIPTLFGILTINFFIIQLCPGGPVEQIIAKYQNNDISTTQRFDGQGQSTIKNVKKLNPSDSKYRGAQGLDPEIIQEIKKLYGFDKPLYVRYFQLIWNFLRFDFGESFFRNQSVLHLILERLPVSISLGCWSVLIIYLVSIPLGIKKAVKHGSSFDVWTSTIIIIGNAVPVFLFAIILILFFASGSYWHLFPLRGLFSYNFAMLPWYVKIIDYFWHLILPITALVIGGFATLTMLTKNSFLEEINKQYVITARAKGLNEKRILYTHVFRNAMLIIISGFPAAFISMFFTGSLLIEVIFSLDGLGLLGFQSTIQRDYPVIFGTLYIFTLIGLLTNLISDIIYVIVDPRINFEAQN